MLKQLACVPNHADRNSASAYIAVAEKPGLPVILAFAEAHRAFLPFDEAVAIGRLYAENRIFCVNPNNSLPLYTAKCSPVWRHP